MCLLFLFFYEILTIIKRWSQSSRTALRSLSLSQQKSVPGNLAEKCPRIRKPRKAFLSHTVTANQGNRKFREENDIFHDPHIPAVPLTVWWCDKLEFSLDKARGYGDGAPRYARLDVGFLSSEDVLLKLESLRMTVMLTVERKY